MPHGLMRLCGERAPACRAVMIAIIWLGAWIGAVHAESIRVVDAQGRNLVLPAPAQRIVSLLPSLTESVCVLDACDRLIGVDRASNWPESVRALPRLGGLEDTQIERILALRPDLVLAPVSLRARGRLESLGLRVLALEPLTTADAQRALEAIAQAIGRPAAAQAAWQSMQVRIDAAATRVPASFRSRRVYFEVAETPYAAGEASFVGELLSQLGLRNIVPAALGPFPRLNPEFVVRSEPDLIIATRAALSGMRQRPGWQHMLALRTQQTCGFTSEAFDLLVRPGPRLAEGAELLAACLESIRSSAP
jgi:iron complex transport system substrate-binding protein